MSNEPSSRLSPQPTETTGSLNSEHRQLYEKSLQELQSNGLQQYHNLYDEVDYSGDDEDDIVQNILSESFLSEPALYGSRSVSVTPQQKDSKRAEQSSRSYETSKPTNNGTEQISSNGCSSSQKQERSSVDIATNSSSSRTTQVSIPAITEPRISREGGKKEESKISRPRSSPVSISRNGSEIGQSHRKDESKRRYGHGLRPDGTESGRVSNADVGGRERGNASDLPRIPATIEASSRSAKSESNRILSGARRDSQLTESSSLAGQSRSLPKKVITDPRRKSPRRQSFGAAEVAKIWSLAVPSRPSTVEATMTHKEMAPTSEGAQTGVQGPTRDAPRASELKSGRTERRDSGRGCNEVGSRSEVDSRYRAQVHHTIPTGSTHASLKGNEAGRNSSVLDNRGSSIKKLVTDLIPATNDRPSINLGKMEAPLIDGRGDPSKDHLRDVGHRSGIVDTEKIASSCEANALNTADKKEKCMTRNDTIQKPRKSGRKEPADAVNTRRGQPSSSGSMTGRVRASGANEQPLGVRASAGPNDVTLRVQVQTPDAQSSSIRVFSSNDLPLGVRSSAANPLPSNNSRGEKGIGKSPNVRPSGANQFPLGVRRKSSGRNESNKDLGNSALRSPITETAPSESKVPAGTLLSSRQFKEKSEQISPAIPDSGIRKIERCPPATSSLFPDHTEPKVTATEIKTTPAVERKQSSGGLLRKRSSEPGDELPREESSGWVKRMRLAADERQTANLLASRQSDQFTATGNKTNQSTINERTHRIPPVLNGSSMSTSASPQLKNVDTLSRDISVNAGPQSSRVRGTPSKPDTAISTKRDARTSTSSRTSHSNEMRNSLNAHASATQEGTHPPLNKTAGIKTRLGKRIPPIPPRTRSFASDDIGIMEKLSRHIEVRSDRHPRGHADSQVLQIDRESRQSKPHRVSIATAQPPLRRADVQIRPDEIKYPHTISRNSAIRQDHERKHNSQDIEMRETVRKQPSQDRGKEQRTRSGFDTALINPSVKPMTNLSPRSGSGSNDRSRSLYPVDRAMSYKKDSGHGKPNTPVILQVGSSADIRQEIPSVIDGRREVNMDGVPTQPRSMEISRNVPPPPPLRYTRPLGPQSSARPPHSNMDDIPKQPRNFHRPPIPPTFSSARASHPGRASRHRPSLSFEERRHHPYERAPQSGQSQTHPARQRREFDTKINYAGINDERSNVRR